VHAERQCAQVGRLAFFRRAGYPKHHRWPVTEGDIPGPGNRHARRHLMRTTCSIAMRDPHNVDVLYRLQSRLEAANVRVLVVHDGFGTASFVSHGSEVALRERVRAAIDAELGSTWAHHFEALP
jgi:hypothetical protein